MKSLLIVSVFLALVACKSAMVPTAAEDECRARHNLMPGTTEYADCVKQLSHSESELRHSK